MSALRRVSGLEVFLSEHVLLLAVVIMIAIAAAVWRVML